MKFREIIQESRVQSSGKIGDALTAAGAYANAQQEGKNVLITVKMFVNGKTVSADAKKIIADLGAKVDTDGGDYVIFIMNGNARKIFK